MTLSTLSVKTEFPGTGGAGGLTPAFRAFATNEVEVWCVNRTAGAIGVYAANSATLLDVTTHYTIAISSPLPAQVTVTPVSPATDFAANLTWVIVRRAPQTQLVAYTAADELPVAAHERAMDRAVMLTQLLEFYRSRAVHLAEHDVDLSMQLANVATRKGKLLFFDTATGALTYVTIASIVPGNVAFSSIGQSIAEAANADAVIALVGCVENDGNVRHARVDVIANRPAAGTFGLGLFVSSDERRLYYSDGATWFEEVVHSDLFANLSTAAGRVGIATDRRQLYRGDGVAARLIRSLPPAYLKVDDVSGSYISRPAAQTIQVTANLYGRATLPAASSDQLDWRTTSAISKTFGGTWAAGTGNAGLAAGAVAVATWYHCFILTKADGSTDMGFDTNVDGSALLANAAVIAAGYTHAQLIFSTRTQDTDAGSRVLIDFVQRHRHVYWNQNLTLTELDNNGTANGQDRRDAAGVDYTAGVNITLRRVPTGYPVVAHLIFIMIAGQFSGLVRPGGLVSVQPGVAIPSVTWLTPNMHWSGINNVTEGDHHVLTNSSAQILVTSRAGDGADDQIQCSVLGYEFPFYG